jgi:alkylation response protein AidB-like acyl-CoA dehydrogenase
MASQALDLQGHFGLLDGAGEALCNGAFQHRFLWAPGLRLGGGTDEIMKNIIAERVLGLPADIRVDKNVPFRDIPHGR